MKFDDAPDQAEVAMATQLPGSGQASGSLFVAMDGALITDTMPFSSGEKPSRASSVCSGRLGCRFITIRERMSPDGDTPAMAVR